MYGLVGIAVVVHVAVGGEFTLWELCNLGAGAPLGIGHEFIDIPIDGVYSGLLCELGQAARASSVCRHLGAKVTGSFSFGADLSQDESKNVCDYLAGSHQLDRRNDDAFLIDLAKRHLRWRERPRPRQRGAPYLPRSRKAHRRSRPGK